MKPITTNGVTFFKKDNNYFISVTEEDNKILIEFKRDKNACHLVFNDYVSQIVNEVKEPLISLDLKGMK